MKITTKERLNDKARKMIDLIYDQVYNGGEESIKASFIDKKSGLKYELTVGIKVGNPIDEIPPEIPQFEPDCSETDLYGEEDEES